jgi:hypothetical protein
VREVFDSDDDKPLFRMVGRHSNKQSTARLEFADGQVHHLPVRGSKESNAQMAVINDAGEPYIRIRRAREPCPRGSVAEAVAEPNAKITAERLMIIALASNCLPMYFIRN